MNVSIGDHWEKFVEALVRSGRFGSASDVVDEGLRLIEQRELRLEALRGEIEAALAEGGAFTDAEVEAAIEDRLAQRPRRAG